MSLPGFVFTSPASAVLVETIEISHPSFSRIYRLVRNATKGFNGRGGLSFEYCPMRIEQIGARGLNFGIRVVLGDLGSIIPAELARVVAAGTARTKPSVVYRTYRSDTRQPLEGYGLEMGPLTRTGEGASFEARAPAQNLNRTGERYLLDRFPMLRSTL